MPELANALAQLRFDNGRMSQAALAKAVGVSRQTINSIETGRYHPSIVLALRIAEFFGKSVREVFWLEESDES
jgi:putative transcriptional regulator